jgi:glycerol-3-phosphate O-acyltransferase / dihydroxyacetone phosphate acyltransferase
VLRAALRRVLDEALALLARVLLHVFFREVEVVGGERLRGTGPLLIVANHENNLVDPILILGLSGRRPRFLAKSTLWSHPVVAPFLMLSGALPVYRRHDAGEDVTRNFETFARCREALAAGSTIALFPEGHSHNEPRRLPLKTGAARIALETEARHGPLGLKIVPVGLTYEEKGKFRSRVLVRVGDPIDPAPEAAEYEAHGRTATRALTQRLAEALETVTVSYASWEHAHLIDRAVALATTSDAGVPLPLSGRWPLWKAFVHRHARLLAEDPERAASLTGRLRRYEEERLAAGLSDAEVAAGRPRSSAGEVVRQVLVGALELPAAVVGAVLNWIPFRFAGWVARSYGRLPDEPATYKMMAALVAFPVSWIFEALLAAALWRPAAGLALMVVAPASGYAALLFLEERLRPLRRRRGRPPESRWSELRTRRAELQRDILQVGAEDA